MSNSLAFSLQNDKQNPVIYITSDPSLNKLTFTVANVGSTVLQLTGGTPIAETSREANSPSALYLTFGSLLTPVEFKNLQWSADGWQVNYFTDGGVINWGLTPKKDLQIPAQGRVSFDLKNVTATHRPMSGFLTVDYYGIGSLPDNSFQVKVFLQNPPIKGRKDLKIDGDFVGGSQVTISPSVSQPISNKLSFYLSNPDPTHPIVPSSTPWESNPPVFILSFVEGIPPGYGALTSIELATNITVNPNGQAATKWQVVASTDSQNPYWRLLPQNHEILGIGSASTVEFDLAGIVSFLQAGLTPMYVQWANIPGYNDGFTSVIIQKVAPLKVDSFYTAPGFAEKANIPLQVSVKWEVEHATSLELRSPQGDFDVTNKNAWLLPKPVNTSMALTLHATGADGKFIDRNVDFKVLDFKVTLNPVTDLPQTFGFQYTVYSQKWNMAYYMDTRGNFYVVDTQQNTVLSKNTFSVQYSGALKASTSIDDSFDRLYMYDVNAYVIFVLNIDSSGKVTVLKKLKTPQYSGSNIAPSPDGQTVYFVGGTKNSVGYFHISDYVLRYGPAFQVHSSDTRDLIVSQDGRYLYLGTGGDAVQQWDIEQQVMSSPLIKVGKGYSWNLAITPDGKQLYITNYTGKSVTAIFTEEQFRTEVIPMKGNAFILGMSPDGSIIYALAGHETISMIDTASNKVVYNLLIKSVPAGQGGLVGIAVAPNGKKLYLADNIGNFNSACVDIELVGTLSKLTAK